MHCDFGHSKLKACPTAVGHARKALMSKTSYCLLGGCYGGQLAPLAGAVVAPHVF
jgi:hypothetical protein